ncbi:MAG TPA: hypothetical protein VFA02_05625 [Pseudacidobacterium sp.]|nr:hypothetical protein [Pseudacidobacterium sp.]
MKAAHNVVLGLILISGAALKCSAQEPQSPHVAASHAELASASSDNKVPAALLPSAPSSATVAPTPSPLQVPRVANKKYFLLNGFQLGMAVFDVEMTQLCIRNHRCREANPLMPSSHVGQLSVNFALVAYSSGVSYWLKKRRSKVWWLPPCAGIVVHSIGVATGFEHQ